MANNFGIIKFSLYLFADCGFCPIFASTFKAARMVESVDTRDLKSLGQWCPCGFKSRFEYEKSDVLQACRSFSSVLLSPTVFFAQRIFLRGDKISIRFCRFHRRCGPDPPPPKWLQDRFAQLCNDEKVVTRRHCLAEKCGSVGVVFAVLLYW